MDMNKFTERLYKVPDTYFGFMTGVLSYVKNNPDRYNLVFNFLNTSEELTSSEILEFIMSQPDFFEDNTQTARAV